MPTSERRTKTRDLSPLTIALAARLRSVAAENLKTQADLVRATGIDKRQVSLIWRGMQMMDVDQMQALFTAAGADPAEQFAHAQRNVREAQAQRLRVKGASGDASRRVSESEAG